MSQRDDAPDDPVIELAREYVRTFGGEGAVKRFEDALEEHGIRKAIEEAAIGVGAGFLLQRIRSQQQSAADQAAPNVDEVELPADQPRTGTALRIDDPGHGDVSVREPRAHEEEAVYDGAVMIETDSGTYFWDVGFEYGDLEPITEPKHGVAHVAVLVPIEEAEVVAVEDVQEADVDVDVDAVDEGEGGEEA